jgi:hypothetical protein
MSVERNVPKAVTDVADCGRTRRDNHASSCIQRYPSAFTLQHKIRAQIVSATPRTEALRPLKVQLRARAVDWETTLDASLKTEIHPHLSPPLDAPLSSLTSHRIRQGTGSSWDPVCGGERNGAPAGSVSLGDRCRRGSENPVQPVLRCAQGGGTDASKRGPTPVVRGEAGASHQSLQTKAQARRPRPLPSASTPPKPE